MSFFFFLSRSTLEKGFGLKGLLARLTDTHERLNLREIGTGRLPKGLQLRSLSSSLRRAGAAPELPVKKHGRSTDCALYLKSCYFEAFVVAGMKH